MGLSNKENLGKLKRAIAREVFRRLSAPVATPGVDDLQSLRLDKNITLTTAANQFGVWPTTDFQ